MAVVETIVKDERWRALAGVEALATAGAEAALAACGIRLRADAEASVLLAGDATIADLNRQWRGKAGPTNVLSFPAAAPALLPDSPAIGDIALAYETCRREAEEQGKSLSDHLSHLVVHGALHLAGYDHLTDADAERMEALEVRILAELGVPNPYDDEREDGT